MDRKLNPMKLLDAGAGLFTSAVKSTANLIKQGPSVADRITSMVRGDASPRGDADRDAIGDASHMLKLENLRVTVQCDQYTNVDTTIFHIALVDRKTNETMRQCDRRWSDCEPVVSFIRGLYPKMELGPSPKAPTGRSAAIVVEERRKFLQSFLTTCSNHAGAAKVKEVQDLCGLKDGASSSFTHATPARKGDDTHSVTSAVISTPTPKPPLNHRPPPTEPPVTSTSFAGGDSLQMSPSDTFSVSAQNTREFSPTPSPSTASFRLGGTASSIASGAVGAAETEADTRANIDACFKVLDADDAGYVMIEDVRHFFSIVTATDATPLASAAGGNPAPLPRFAAQTLDELDKSGGGLIDAKVFRQGVMKLAQAARQPFSAMYQRFKRQRVLCLYHLLAAWSESGGKDIPAQSSLYPASMATFDPVECHAFLFVVQSSGIRAIAVADVERMDKRLTFLRDEFEDVAATLLDVIPMDELFRAMQVGHSREKHRVVSLMTKYASKANPDVARSLKNKIAQYGGMSCANCTATQQQLSKLQREMKELLADKQKLALAVDKLSRQVAEAEDKRGRMAALVEEKDGSIAELRSSVSQLTMQVDHLKESEDRMQTKLCDVEADLDIERDKRAALLQTVAVTGAGGGGASGGSSRGLVEFMDDDDDEDDDDAPRAGGKKPSAAWGSTCQVTMLTPNGPAARPQSSRILLGASAPPPVIDQPGALVFDIDQLQLDAHSAAGGAAGAITNSHRRNRRVARERGLQDGSMIADTSACGEQITPNDGGENPEATEQTRVARSLLTFGRPMDDLLRPRFDSSLAVADVTSTSGAQRTLQAAATFEDDCGFRVDGHHPMGFTLDIFVSDTNVTEYVACRDRQGRRSFAWTCDQGYLVFPWVPKKLVLPVDRWLRLSIKLRWEDSTYDVVSDGELWRGRVPFVDGAEVDGVSVLDMFPRDAVACCYANVHFFS